jgi:hypothetical protein
MKKYFVCIIIFYFLVSPLKSADLKLIKTIGNDEENYIFARISGAILSKNLDIYVVDLKLNCIAKYNWDKKFIKKIGKQGQGPGCFNGPGYLNIYKDKLYLYDSRNVRIAEMDLDLNNLKYHRHYDGIPFFNNFYVINETTFIGNSFCIEEEERKNTIKVIDIKSNAIYSFFDHIPIKESRKSKEFSDDAFLRRFFFNPRFGINRKSGKAIISFIYPDNPVEFFIYSLSGECLDKFSYEIEEKYEFPEFLLKRPIKYPSTYYQAMVNSILFYKKYYIVFWAKFKYRRKIFESGKKLCLIFDESNNSLKYKFSVDSDLEPFFISDDGYLLARKYMGLTEKLYIYKLEI